MSGLYKPFALSLQLCLAAEPELSDGSGQMLPIMAVLGPFSGILFASELVRAKGHPDVFGNRTFQQLT